MSDDGAFRIVIDGDKCTGHGRCYGSWEDLFEPYDAEGRSRPLQEIVSGDAFARTCRAADSCPEGAISLVRIDDSR